MQKLYDELGARGLGVLAVNRGDPAGQVLTFFKEHGLTFPCVLGGKGAEYTVGPAYRVVTYPTAYLLDSGRRVVWAGVGYDARSLREAVNSHLR